VPGDRDLGPLEIGRLSMTTATKSHGGNGASPDLQTIVSDVAALKRDLASLVRKVRTDVSGDVARARGAAGHLGDEASRVYGNAVTRGGRSVNAIGRQVKVRPVLSLLVAFAIGVIGSRMLARR
jgi:hypothetical protein